MTKPEYDFIKAEIEREKNASPFYLACRMLPENYEELKKEYYNECIRDRWKEVLIDTALHILKS